MLKFQKKTAIDIKETERIEKEAKQLSDEMIAAAQGCLANEDFQKYKEAYLKFEKISIEELMEIDKMEDDPVKYGFQAKDVISKLKVVRSFVINVEQDAGKRT